MAAGLDLNEALRLHRHVLLDTCVLIAEFKRPTGRLLGINRPQRATSIIAVWEFLHGSAGALLPARERNDRRSWLDEQGIVRLRLSGNCSRAFEHLLNGEGPVGVADALLAAESLARHYPVVTSNIRHFESITGLRYVAW